MQICKRYITEFENCTFRNVEGTVFNYCKIQARERPENIKEKSPLVFTASGS
jgi:hypothetical protein